MHDQALRSPVVVAHRVRARSTAQPQPAPAARTRSGHRLDAVSAAHAPSPDEQEPVGAGDGAGPSEDVGPSGDGGVTADSGEEIAAKSESDQVGDFPTPKEEPEEAAAAVVAPSFVDGGRTGTIRWGDPPLAAGIRCAYSFTAGGMTGTTTWGPAGAHNNEALGSIQSEVAATFGGQSAAPPNPAQAWVQNGTGTLQVTRSYTGVSSGNQGNGYFVTAAAAARINQHEVGHVNSTKGFHDTDLKPLLDKILSYTQAQAGRGTGADQPAATAALRTTLNLPAAWTTAKSNFSTHDNAANKPGGTWDTADVASGTYVTDIGAGNVGGTAFTHRIKTPGEAAPT